MLLISAPRRVPAAYLLLYELLTLRAAYLGKLNQGIYDTLGAAHLGRLNQGLSSILTFARPNKRNDSRRRHSLVRRSCCLRCSTSFLREIGYCILSQTLEWIGWHLSYNTLEWYIYIYYTSKYISWGYVKPVVRAIKVSHSLQVWVPTKYPISQLMVLV